MPLRLLKLLSFAFFCLILLACVQKVVVPIEPVDPVKVSEPGDLEKIANMVDLACQNDNQCKVIGVGAAACGGPKQYFIYSTKNNTGKLIERVKAYNATQKQKNAEVQAVGICRHLSPPKTMCSKTANKCIKPSVDHL